MPDGFNQPEEIEEMESEEALRWLGDVYDRLQAIKDNAIIESDEQSIERIEGAQDEICACIKQVEQHRLDY